MRHGCFKIMVEREIQPLEKVEPKQQLFEILFYYLLEYLLVRLVDEDDVLYEDGVLDEDDLLDDVLLERFLDEDEPLFGALLFERFVDDDDNDDNDDERD